MSIKIPISYNSEFCAGFPAGGCFVIVFFYTAMYLVIHIESYNVTDMFYKCSTTTQVSCFYIPIHTDKCGTTVL